MRKLLLACLLTVSAFPATAEPTKEDYVSMARKAWTYLQCSFFANDLDMNNSLFFRQAGYYLGVEFLDAVETGKARLTDMLGKAPDGFLMTSGIWGDERIVYAYRMGRITALANLEALESMGPSSGRDIDKQVEVARSHYIEKKCDSLEAEMKAYVRSELKREREALPK